MNETLACGYSFNSTLQELSNEYQYDRVYKSLPSCALVESTLSIISVNKPF